MKYVKQFVIASSILAMIPFLVAVNLSQHKNYTYFGYSIVAPIWLGFLNVVSLVIANRLGLTTNNRFILITAISYLSSLAIVEYTNSYQPLPDNYWLWLLVIHLIYWNIIVRYIEQVI